VHELKEFVVGLFCFVVTLAVLATLVMAAYRVCKWVWLG